MRLLRFVAPVALSCIFASGASAQCVRHIYNNSGGTWIVNFNAQIPNVNFQNFCSNVGSGPCTIPPGGVVEIDYYGGSGTVDITDETGAVNGWYYGPLTMFQCPQIAHDGNTGSVALNDPADGDIHMWGPNTWGDGVSMAIPAKRDWRDVEPKPALRLPPPPRLKPAKPPKAPKPAKAPAKPKGEAD